MSAGGLLGRRAPPGHRWQVDVSLGSFPRFADHRLQGMVVLPGSAYLELAVAAAAAIDGRPPSTVDNMVFERAFVIPPDGARALLVTLTPGSAGGWDFLATGVATGVRHASARIPGAGGEPVPGALDPTDPSWWQGEQITGDDLYARLLAAGNDFGPAYRWVQRCWAGGGQATAVFTAVSAVDSRSDALPDPALIDTAMQVLTATIDGADNTVALVGWDRLRLHGTRASGGRVFARLRSGPDRAGDVLVVDHAGRPVLELTGVRLRAFPLPRQALPRPEIPVPTIAVTATFTAEPLHDPLSFWFDLLGIPARIEFAGYNQPFQQLLDPASLLSTNSFGANVVLVRPDDLSRGRAATSGNRFTVPEMGEIDQVLPFETEFLYDEIFTRQAYTRHGIGLRDGDCVFDVGANIGMFTLFVHSRCDNPRVYAFEPAPPVLEVLRRNVSTHCPNTTVCGYGLADVGGQRPFTYYRNSTAFSGFAADPAKDRAAVEAVVGNLVRTVVPGDSPHLAALVAELTHGRLDAEVYTCETRTLSSVLAEHAIDRIDLLKIDVEGSELAVLRGVEDEHWPLIRQVVAEAHDRASAEQVRELLVRHGFRVELDQPDELLHGTGFVQVFARREARPEPPARSDVADELIRAVEACRRSTGVPCVVVLCPGDPGFEHLADRLARGLAAVPGVQVVTAAELQRTYPVPDHRDERAERLGAVPYTGRFFTALGTMIARRYLAAQQPPVKVIALDCDQTLWAGVCGEDGPLGVRIDEPRRALQEFVLAQHRAGTLICLCSKNNPEDVHAVFAQRADMPLRLEHIAAARVGWSDKSAGLAGLAADLGLGLDGFVFLDDDPVECAEVRARRPEVLTLRLPGAADDIPRFLRHSWAFDRLRLTEEDRARAGRYREERQRRIARERAPSLRSFLDTLELRVRIAPYRQADLARVAQLVQRTNQFTATAIRRTEAGLHELLASGTVDCRTVRVADRFGDYGLVGVLLFGAADEALLVDSFLLSCRALGRGVEHRMLAELGKIASEHGLDRVVVPVVPTGRNEPARRFFDAVADESRADEAGVRYGIAAARAARLVFDPASSPDQRPVPGPAPVPAGRPSSLVHQRIADELSSLDDIVDAIERWRIRPRPALRNAVATPDDDLERTLAELWRQVLGVDEVGVDDNFFELGGTSLRAVQLMVELSERAGIALPSIDVFERTTIRAMAAMLRAGEDPDRTGVSGHRRGQRRRAAHRRLRRPVDRSEVDDT